jgi:hypothetical protein
VLPLRITETIAQESSAAEPAEYRCPGCNIDDNGGIVMSGVENITANKIGIVGSYVNSGTPLSMTADLIVSNMTFSGSTNITNYTTINGTTPLGSGGAGGASLALVE